MSKISATSRYAFVASSSDLTGETWHKKGLALRLSEVFDFSVPIGTAGVSLQYY